MPWPEFRTEYNPGTQFTAARQSLVFLSFSLCSLALALGLGTTGKTATLIRIHTWIRAP